MTGKLEVSFNSPQCGWMSIGFADGMNEFHTTTAHAPYPEALPRLMGLLGELAAGREPTAEYVLRWNRDPEAYDLRFVRDDDKLLMQIIQYPTEERHPADGEMMFSHVDNVENVCRAFAATFDQLYADRQTDEFEFNWRQPFPLREYEEFTKRVGR